MSWADEETELLIKLDAEDLSTHTIARIMSKPVASITAKLNIIKEPERAIRKAIDNRMNMERLHQIRAQESEYVDMRDFTAQFMGDPPYQRSALYDHLKNQEKLADEAGLLPPLEVRKSIPHWGVGHG